MNVKNKKGHAKGRAGIALLLSLLIMAAVTTIMFAISDIAVKEFQLSAVGRESQKAYYAAETGYECAKYWEDTQHAFSRTTGGTIAVECNGVAQGSYDKAAALAKYNTDPPGPETHTPAITLPNYNGLPIRVVVEPPGTSPTVRIQVTAENTTIANTARKVQRTFEGFTNACFANADVLLVIDRSEHVCNDFAREYAIESGCPDVDSAKTAAQAFVNALSPTTGPTGTRMGMLSFASTVSYPGGPTVDHIDGVSYGPAGPPPFPPHVGNHIGPTGHNASAPLGSSAATINGEIGQILPGGKPNTPEAIARAVDEFNLRGRSGVKRFIVLITNRNPRVVAYHDLAASGNNIATSPTALACFGPSHEHDETAGPPPGNDVGPERALSRSETVQAASYAKGSGQCDGSLISAPVTIYVVGVNSDPNPDVFDPAFFTSIASPAPPDHYYNAADYSELETTLIDQVAACQ